MYKAGLVSVIIPTYKRTTMLSKAIKSVLGQTYRQLELFVVNDNTPGDEYSQSLYTLMENYADDNRIKLVEQQCHSGGAAARNAGISVAKGEYIAFLDDDDFYEPQKIEIQLSELKKLPIEFGMTTCLSRRHLNGKFISAAAPYKDGNMLLAVLCRVAGIGTGAALIRRVVMEDIGGFDEKLKRHQDIQLFVRICSKYKVKLVKKYLQNSEISDGQNRPNLDELKIIKSTFFASIADIMENLTEKEKKRVFLMHELELASAYRKAGQWRECIKSLTKTFSTPWTAWHAANRILKRVFGKWGKYLLVRRYK